MTRRVATEGRLRPCGGLGKTRPSACPGNVNLRGRWKRILYLCLTFPVIAAMAPAQTAGITIDYPLEGSIFPPEITPPTFLFHDSSPQARSWRVDVDFGGRAPAIHVESKGERMRIGEIDPRCVSPNNELPKLTPEQAGAHTWIPDAAIWAVIKKQSVAAPAVVAFTGIGASGEVRLEERRV